MLYSMLHEIVLEHIMQGYDTNFNLEGELASVWVVCFYYICIVKTYKIPS
jgi:hypothetical protein